MNGSAMLIIADDGPGEPDLPQAASAKQSLGMHIFRGLVTQIGGTLEVRYELGTKIAVQFPVGR